MSVKHIVNEPRELVNESLAGLARLNSNIRVDEASRVVYRADIPKNQVALISGGGSGHEPAHAGFVGQGLLTAAVCGNIFASPNVGQVRRAVDIVNKNNKGTLFVVKRYTGDVLLFGLAKEQASAVNPSHPIRMTIVGDDVAVGRKQGALVGRRGLAGTVLVYKIASALADEGADVDEVHEIAEFVAAQTGTIGAGLEHCHIPGTAKADAHLTESEIEIGMGIHNEAGVEKTKLPTSRELIKRMLKLVTDTKDPERGFVPFKHDKKDEVVLLVNNLGGISELEMTSIANDAVVELESQGITIKRIIVGSVMTSLNLPGFSLTTLLLPREGKFSSERILQLLDAKASAPGWKFMVNGPPGVPEKNAASPPPVAVKSGAEPVAHVDFKLFQTAVSAACENVVKSEPEITRYDTIAGDGDCGLGLKAMAEGVLKAFSAGKVDQNDVSTAVLNLAQVIEKEGDGTSGALFSIFFNALAGGVAKTASAQKSKTATSAVWAGAIEHALNTLYEYTAARRPSRTLVDPLDAFVSHFSASKGSDLKGAVEAATKAADETKDLVAKAGRAAYVGQDELKKAQVPDAGAYGVAKMLQGLAASL